MDWVQVPPSDARPWVVWLDRARALGWRDEAVRLASQAESDRAGQAGTDAQTELVRKLWEALGWYYQSIDTRPVASPAYREPVILSTGGSNGTAGRTASRWDVSVGPGSVDSGAIARGTAELFPRNPDGTRPRLCQGGMKDRIALSELGLPITQCFGVWGAPCGFQGSVDVPAKYAEWGAGGAPYDWRTAAWVYYVPAVAEVLIPCEIVSALPPLYFYYLLGRKITEGIAGRDPLAVIDEARAAVLAYNAISAREAGILPRDLAETVANLEVSALTADAARRQRVGAVIGAVGSVATSVGSALGTPAVGAVIAGIVEAVRFVAQVVPVASGVVTDPFGRVVPVFEVAPISGGAGLGPGNQPTQLVPLPPGMTACPKPPGGLSRLGAQEWQRAHAACVFPSNYTYSDALDTTKAPGGTNTGDKVVEPTPPTPPSGGLLWVGVGALGIATVGGIYAATRR